MSKKCKIVIFGATGRTGSLIVNQALAQGHMVTAYMRTPSKLARAGVQAGHSRLRLLQGDMNDPEKVAEAIAGQDVVLCSLNITSSGASEKSPDSLNLMAQNLIAGMQAHHVERIVSLVGSGVKSPLDPVTLASTLLQGIKQILGHSRLKDFQSYSDLLQNSDLAWTLVRPQRLNDSKRRGSYRTGFSLPGLNINVARADVADFMLKLATEGGYERQAPRIYY